MKQCLENRCSPLRRSKGRGGLVSAVVLFGILARCLGQGTVQFTFEGPAYPGQPQPQPPSTSSTIVEYYESGARFWNPSGPQGLTLVGSGVIWAPDNGSADLQSTGGSVLRFGFASPGVHFNLLSFDLAGDQPGPVAFQVIGYKYDSTTVSTDRGHPLC